MSAQEVDEAIINARRVWAEAISVLDPAGDRALADDLRRLSEELPSLTPDTDVIAWAAPLNRATHRMSELAGHNVAVTVQWSFLDVLIVQSGGIPPQFKA